MEVVGQVVGQSHLPGIHKMNIQSFEHGSEHLVNLVRLPVTVGLRCSKCEFLGVPSPDDNQRVWSSVQQLHHRSADGLQPPDVELHGESAEMSPDAKNDNSVGTSSYTIEFTGHVTQLTYWDRDSADRRTVEAVLHQDVVCIIQGYERSSFPLIVQVKLLQI